MPRATNTSHIPVGSVHCFHGDQVHRKSLSRAECWSDGGDGDVCAADDSYPHQSETLYAHDPNLKITRNSFVR